MELLILFRFLHLLLCQTNLNSNMELLISCTFLTLHFPVLFKFQYGATNIILQLSYYSSFHQFKFQYGATNIHVIIFMQIFIFLFKFQYGATNILELAGCIIYSPRFKFQYGATNISTPLLIILLSLQYLNSNMELLIYYYLFLLS